MFKKLFLGLLFSVCAVLPFSGSQVTAANTEIKDNTIAWYGGRGNWGGGGWGGRYYGGYYGYRPYYNYNYYPYYRYPYYNYGYGYNWY